ncbi:hypothetical protein FKP32DRAFT_1630794 [Trametes sanguinea]|nr:hypothetical protein FKP32DRAFT_1630794 [Trametes sanguinea]
MNYEGVSPPPPSSVLPICLSAVPDTLMNDDVTRTPHPCILERLNYDILERIYEYLRPDRGLHSLSLTCRWVRASCKPVHFRRTITSANFITREHFLPPHLWIYVHSLTFVSFWRYPMPSPSRFHPISLAEAFSQMPRLSRIKIDRTHRRGVPWRALNEILAVPHLRYFEIEDTLQRPCDGTVVDEPDDMLPSPSAPLACYHQVLEDYRSPPRDLLNDVVAIRNVVSQEHIQRSLERLVIPSEVAPLAILPNISWPRLKVVSLRGVIWYQQPLIDVFERMPLLEELCLEAPRPADTGRTLVLCPPNWSRPFPWPRLKRLVVSYPDPDDPLFAHVSSSGTLQRLDLRCWPRHYVHLTLDDRVYMASLKWRSPILKSSELLCLLSRFPAPSLLELAIEYSEDEGDMRLLRCIPVLFPNLTSLTIYRYRQPGVDSVPLRAIGQALSALSCLQICYMHLDLKGAPEPWASTYNRRDNGMAQHKRALANAADIIAQELASSVQVICLLLRELRYNTWRAFRVMRSDGGLHTSHIAPDASNLEIVKEDLQGPPHAYHEYGGL